VEGVRAKSRARLSSASLRRVKPKGAASDGRANPASVARDSRKGQSPEAAARWAGLSASADGKTDGKNGTWVLPGGNAPDTFREEEAPQGESQERRRYEKRPARARREQTAERVAKPCGRNGAGWAGPRKVDLRILMC